MQPSGEAIDRLHVIALLQVTPEQGLYGVLLHACIASNCTHSEACTVLAVHVSVHECVPMAAPKVWYSKVRLVTSDREESALHCGGLPFSDCRFTSDQGMPASNYNSEASKQAGRHTSEDQMQASTPVETAGR